MNERDLKSIKYKLLCLILSLVLCVMFPGNSWADGDLVAPPTSIQHLSVSEGGTKMEFDLTVAKGDTPPQVYVFACADNLIPDATEETGYDHYQVLDDATLSSDPEEMTRTGHVTLTRSASRWDIDEYLILIASSNNYRNTNTMAVISEGTLVDSFPSRIQKVEVGRDYMRTYVNRVAPAGFPNVGGYDLGLYRLEVRAVGDREVIAEGAYPSNSGNQVQSDEKFVFIPCKDDNTLATGQEYEITLVNRSAGNDVPLAYSKFTYRGPAKKASKS